MKMLPLRAAAVGLAVVWLAAPAAARTASASKLRQQGSDVPDAAGSPPASARQQQHFLLRPGGQGRASEVLGDVEALFERWTGMKTDGGQVPPGRLGMHFRPVSASLQCVMGLTVITLLIYTALSVSRNVDELSGKCMPSMLTQTLMVASRAAVLPPMLCMLFVACRLYVLATTQGAGEPPQWVKACMYTASGGMLVQFIVVLLLPTMVDRKAREEAAYDMTEKGRDPAPLATDKPAATEAAPEEGALVLPGEDPPDLSSLTGEHSDAHPLVHMVDYKKPWMAICSWTLQIWALLCTYCGALGIIVGIATFPTGTTQISAAVRATIVLSLLYFAVYLLLWIARTLPESPFQARLLPAARAMSSVARKAPMLAVLFLMVRMRALQIDPPHGLPPPWLQGVFYFITVMLYIETAAAAAVGASGEQKKGYYGVYIYSGGNSALHITQHTCAILVYLALLPLTLGTYLATGPGGVDVPLSTTMKCLLFLEFMYFGVMAGQTLVIFLQWLLDRDLVMLQDTFVAAGISLSFAPMLSVLFVSCRLRALQITQQFGDPPGYAQDCMMLCCFAALVQSVCCLAMPIFIGSACKVDADGNPDYDLRPMVGAYTVTVVKYVALLLLHSGVFTVCIAIGFMTPEEAMVGDQWVMAGSTLYRWLFGLVIIVMLALLFSSAKVVGIAVKLAIESCDRVFLGVDITIASVAIGICKGYVNIRDLVVHQPDEDIEFTKDQAGNTVAKKTGKQLEWKNDYIVKVKTCLVKINLWRLATSLGREFELENLNLSGIYVNVEKKSADLKKKDSNVDYLIQYIESLGMAAAEEEKKQEAPKEVTKEVAKAPEDDKAKPAVASFAPQILLHKIVLGDIGAGVDVINVPLIGHLAFSPKIGLIHFDDIQKDIFEGREDLSAREIVACITRAVSHKIMEKVVHDLPQMIAQKGSSAAQGIGKFVGGLFHHGSGSPHAASTSPTSQS